MSVSAISFSAQIPLKPARFIADLDHSSIGDEAIKAAYPTEYEAISSKMKHGEWELYVFPRLTPWRSF